MSGYHVVVEADQAAMEAVANGVARELCVAYPGHPWHVAIADGCLIIKHLRMSPKWGMKRDLRTVHSSDDLKTSAVRHAGEWLERANLARGTDQGEPIEHVEGIPDKDLIRG